MADWQIELAKTAQRNRLEIVRAKLSRREMTRLGLLTAAGTLIAKHGLTAGITSSTDGTLNADTRTFNSVDLTPGSPPARPWAQPMPRIPVKQRTDPDKLRGGRPDGTTLIEAATKRINHQLFTVDPATGAFIGKFPPKAFYEMDVREAAIQLHPDYGPTTIWGFDGRFPGPMIRATYGEPVLLRLHNALPSVKVAQDFGIAEISTHLHNAHTASESDGFALDYINSINDPIALNPLGFKDHHYANVYAGYQAANDLVGDRREGLSSLWYHDHHVDFTAQNVYKGMAGAYLLFDDLDTGDETTGLRLPSGDYDVPIFFNDFQLNHDFQLVFDIFNLDGILGDRFTANGAIQPVFNVDRRRYRLRLYNPAPSRWIELALFDGTNFLPFWQVSTDGNLLPQAVPVNKVRLSNGARADIIVDFSTYTGSRLYVVNRLEQVNGRGPTGKIFTPGIPLVQVNIGTAAPDYSRDPADPKLGPYLLRELPDPDFGALLARAAKARTRYFKFARTNGAWNINGFLWEENRILADPPQESEEVWVFQNGGGGWAHPVHAHFVEGRVLSLAGTPVQPNTQVDGAIPYARSDIMPLMNGAETRVFFRFRDLKGRYVMHCHNVVHEDHAMMLRFDVT
jgi:FtsP/CotA-like multicopper oxidase with cupredoxin domain